MTANSTIPWPVLLDQSFTVGAYNVKFRAPWWAAVSSDGIVAQVSDYDCSICGEHENGCYCQHFDAMLEAIENALDGTASPDQDDRREAWYQAGKYPPNPLY